MTEGIQPWSLPVKPGAFVVFATVAYPPEYVQDWLRAERIGFKRLQGMWEGQPEESWIVHTEDWEQCAWLAEGEDAVLWIGEPYENKDRPAYVLNLAGNQKRFIGYWNWCTKSEAMRERASTYDPVTDQWYIVRPKRTPVHTVKQRAIKPGGYHFQYPGRQRA